MSKVYEYWDVKIMHIKTRRVYYLRNKRDKKSNEITMTVRTHKNGKGTAKTKPVSAVILGESSIIGLWHVINKKFPFCFVKLESIPDSETGEYHNIE